MKAVPLVIYFVAVIFIGVAIVSALAEMATSVVGGLATLLIALIMLALVGWRVKTKWHQLAKRD